MSTIKIDTNKMEELYQVLYEEKDSAEAMIRILIQFKENIEEQEFDSNSLQQIHYFLDTIINSMELLSANVLSLQDMATKIATEFTWTDAMLADPRRNTSPTNTYDTYERKQFNKEYSR